MARASNNSKITPIPAEDILAVEQSLGLKPKAETSAVEVKDDGTVIETIMEMDGSEGGHVAVPEVPFVEAAETKEDGTVVVTYVTDESPVESAAE